MQKKSVKPLWMKRNKSRKKIVALPERESDKIVLNKISEGCAFCGLFCIGGEEDIIAN